VVSKDTSQGGKCRVSGFAFRNLPASAASVCVHSNRSALLTLHSYIYSDVLRNRFLGGWGLPPSDWWLPNDEGCPAIIRSIKDFIQERTTAPKDDVSENLREMRGIFGTLTISDSPPDDTSSNATEETPTLGSVGTNTDDLHYTGSPPEYEYGYDAKASSKEAPASRQFS
jgi:hypothetical protein